MDLAKIRKKIKDLEAGRDPNAPEEAPAPVENVVEPPVTQGPSEDQTLPAAEKQEIVIQETEQGVQEIRKDQEASKVKEDKEGHKTFDKEIEPEHGEVVEILTFKLYKEEFAFRISMLEEILRHQQITKVPRAPKYVLGITSLRGKIIPVIDLGSRLSLTDNSEYKDRKRKILIIRGPKGPIGAVVDRVIGVVRIAKSEVLPPPSNLSDSELKFIDGVAVVDKRFVSIINTEEAVSIRTK